MAQYDLEDGNNVAEWEGNFQTPFLKEQGITASLYENLFEKMLLYNNQLLSLENYLFSQLVPTEASKPPCQSSFKSAKTVN